MSHRHNRNGDKHRYRSKSRSHSRSHSDHDAHSRKSRHRSRRHDPKRRDKRRRHKKRRYRRHSKRRRRHRTSPSYSRSRSRSSYRSGSRSQSRSASPTQYYTQRFIAKDIGNIGDSFIGNIGRDAYNKSNNRTKIIHKHADPNRFDLFKALFNLLRPSQTNMKQQLYYKYKMYAIYNCLRVVYEDKLFELMEKIGGKKCTFKEWLRNEYKAKIIGYNFMYKLYQKVHKLDRNDYFKTVERFERKFNRNFPDNIIIFKSPQEWDQWDFLAAACMENLSDGQLTLIHSLHINNKSMIGSLTQNELLNEAKNRIQCAKAITLDELLEIYSFLSKWN